MPVYNDWSSAESVVTELDGVFREENLRASILLVNDGSSSPRPDAYLARKVANIDRVDVLALRRNVGHQRAIALGLTYIYEQRPCDTIVIMDADGEDRPQDVRMLLQKLRDENGKQIVFAERRRRSESTLFVFFYHLYCLIHVLLTGIRVRVGNFSVVPFHCLGTLAVSAELWNHYAAAVLHSRLPHTMVPTQRGKRISGQSKMNFVSLVTHGLRAISVYSDIVGVRLLIAAAGLMTVVGGLIAALIVIRTATDWAVPAWAAYAPWLLLILLMQIAGLSFAFVLFVLHTNEGAHFLPLRDYRYFIQGVEEISTP